MMGLTDGEMRRLNSNHNLNLNLIAYASIDCFQ